MMTTTNAKCAAHAHAHFYFVFAIIYYFMFTQNHTADTSDIIFFMFFGSNPAFLFVMYTITRNIILNRSATENIDMNKIQLILENNILT